MEPSEEPLERVWDFLYTTGKSRLQVGAGPRGAWQQAIALYRILLMSELAV
jgi:hypothetical protein